MNSVLGRGGDAPKSRGRGRFRRYGSSWYFHIAVTGEGEYKSRPATSNIVAGVSIMLVVVLLVVVILLDFKAV